MTQYIYNAKKNDNFSRTGERMPKTTRVALQDLQIGDILLVTDYSYNGHAAGAMKSVTVTAIEEEPKHKRPTIGWGDNAGKPVSYRTYKLTTVDGNGKVEEVENLRMKETGMFMRQCSEAQARRDKQVDEILGFRGAVRTLLGMAESAMGERPRYKSLQSYWDQVAEIVDRLTALERQMTIDAGRDPEKDKRKTTNHRGRARR